MTKVAILQSNYIPWKGYFDLINQVDVFVLYDDMQYTRRDWRNRNLIKTPQGLKWLSIPVEVKGKYFQKINETKISDLSWAEQHWKSIQCNYSKADCFKSYASSFETLFNQASNEYFLSQINFMFIQKINEILNINTQIVWSSDFKLADGKTERLVDLCSQLNATEYISGPSAKDYIDDNLFKDANIKLSYIDYAGYPEYKQLYGQFEHGVTILDLIFNMGIESLNFMKRISI